MTTSTGKNAATSLAALVDAYFDIVPDADNPAQRVAFGTSGHRGTSLSGSFNEAHILAITQAVCDYRASQGISGPLFMGKDTHALSAPALETALEVLAAAGVQAHIQADSLPTPTPVISNAVLCHNAKGQGGVADGIVITPSHNPPEDGGFKYNESHGGPAGTQVTAWIQERANQYLASGNRGVKRLGAGGARKAACVREIDFIMPYVRALEQVLNMRAIASSGLRLGADPLGGAALPYWEPIAEIYKLDLVLVNRELDPLFRFMPEDHDGKIRMDCSSPYAMAGLIKHAADYDIAFGNDPDADRHGIVTPAGLMNPNHYLCAAVFFLLQHRPLWPGKAAVGKTCVTSSMMNRVCQALERELYETPVGFKWFVQGLLSGDLNFGGEESAGASFLRLDGRPWSTDKDGIIMNLLAAEISASLGVNPAQLYTKLTERFGEPHYARIDAAATTEEKKAFKNLDPKAVTRKELAGSPVTGVFTTAPGNREAIGGLKVESADGWFAARPSGTEDIYKIYAESFINAEHLAAIQNEAKEIVADIFAAADKQ
ncbi:phosphoglucomutase (alpha-D-glucose-1,6-bisphosphate-dependent) [Desulfovibrio sp. OttesenSCG-928-M14]|nr:phosphoglucomutase (alpha-D-glucose-1,6-bisphosphate-dependent) [Desulfovibrio sp. OttesenSCG-928-M14]